MNKKIALLFVIAGLSLAAALPLSAQRTAKGEYFLSADGSFIPVKGWGADIRFGLYTMRGVWDAGIFSRSQKYNLVDGSSSADASGLNITARCGYLYRLVSTRDRVVNLYAGGGILLGAALLKSDEYTLSTLGYDAPPVGFIYGVYPKVEMELFLFNNVALAIGASAPFDFSTKSFSVAYDIMRFVHAELSAGLKINF